MARVSNFLILICSFMNAQPQLYDFSYDGDNRQYYLYTPDSLEAGAALIFVFHGYSSSAATIMGYSDLNDLADEMGLWYVIPRDLLMIGTTDFGMSGMSFIQMKHIKIIINNKK